MADKTLTLHFSMLSVRVAYGAFGDSPLYNENTLTSTCLEEKRNYSHRRN